MSAADLARIAKRIRAALKFASSCREIGFSAKAADLWSRKISLNSTADRVGPFWCGNVKGPKPRHVESSAIYALMERERPGVESST